MGATSEPRIHNRLESIAQRLRIRRIRVAPESMRAIEIDEFVQRDEIDPRYVVRPYYLHPDGKMGHDAFAIMPKERQLGEGHECAAVSVR